MSHHPTRHPLRRAVGLLAVPALTLSTLAVLPTSPAYAAEPDTAPVAGGAAWMESQLEDGLLVNDQFDFTDYGLTIDFALALNEVGREATVDTISAAIADNVASYTTGVDFGSDDIYAGAVGKAAVLATIAGDDPAAYGGVDLIERLESLTSETAPIAGRIEDVTTFPDSANVIGQGFAVRALTVTGSSEARAATDFLLDQQCSDGYFRVFFESDKAAPEQGCVDGDEAGSGADVDATALTLVNLIESGGADPDVTAAIDSGIAWLLDQQRADGAFGGSGAETAANSNSTGMAGWALAAAGESEAAAGAAGWVQDLQVTALGACSGSPLGSDTGAIAYNDEAFTLGAQEGITEATADQWRRAIAQALPALLSLPDSAGLAEVRVDAPTSFRRAGSKVTLTVSGLGEGEAACLQGPGTSRSLTGPVGSVRVELPAGSGQRRFSLVRLGEGATTTVRALDAKNLKVDLKKSKVARGKKQVAKVKGLADGESVTVFRGDKRVDKGRANDDGRFTTDKFGVGKVGKTKVKVVGQFDNRKGRESFRVVRSR